MTKNLLKLTNEDNEKISKNYSGGEHDFYHQDLEEENVKDAKGWLDEGEMVGIVSEIHGGIIGYVHRDHADDIATILNLHAIDRVKK
jgi:hypothetical protein